MPWEEFAQLLQGLSSETALGRIVAIRSEDDPEVIERFSNHQKEIHRKWKNKTAKAKTQEETDAFLKSMENMFIAMAGGVHH